MKKEMLECLKIFVEPGSVTELRAFGDATYHGTFDHAHLGEMARIAGEMSSCRGVYFLPNPISLTATNRIATSGKCATDADVVRRRWVLIDIDPERPKDTNATQSERDAAWRVAKNCHALLEALGWQAPIVASSGNGWHLCYAVDLPNDDQQRDSIKALLVGLQERCGRGGANVDLKTYNASRIWKLYGTTPSKGRHTDDRPARQSWVKDAPIPDDKIRSSNNKSLSRTILAWRKQAEAYATIEAKPTPSAPSDAYRRAEACLAKTAVSVSGQGGHDAAFHAAMLAVEGFGLSADESFSVMQSWNARCSPPWSERELRHKISDALKLARNPGHMMAQSLPSKIAAPSATYTGPEQVPSDEVEDDATATDLIALNSSITWLWPGWIQKGTLTALAAEPGVGKTRLCADLLKRMTNGIDWPDGQPMTVERGAKVIWIAADSQWAELATIPDHFGFAPDSIILNGTKLNPYGGTNFDTIEDFAKLERRIIRTKPACVYIDTIGNATDKEMTRPDQAKQIFKPLAEIATRTGTSIVLVTHLNKEGQALGRRIIGAVRQVIKLECPDPQGEPNRRKLYVDKSNSMKPRALGVTMNTGGNDYDGSPPTPASSEPGKTSSPRSSHLSEDAAWLGLLLADGLERRVKDIIDAGAEKGISVDRCYKAMRSLGGKVVESSAGNRKFWQLIGGAQ